jgi:hypothetical protein
VPSGSAGTQPWVMNACFTIRAESEEEAGEIYRRLDNYAKRIGAGAAFCDWSETDSEAAR